MSTIASVSWHSGPWIAGRIALLLLASASGSAYAGPETTGQWSRVYEWPDVAIHLHLLPDGNVLSWSDDDDDHFPRQGARKAGFTKTYVVDVPSNRGPGDVTYIPNDTTNLFCSGHTFLPDGRLLVVGGHEGANDVGSKNVNTFSYRRYRWREHSDETMRSGRWYPTAITLASGEALVLGGNQTGPKDPNPVPEVWQTGLGGGWRALTSALLAVPLYPFLHVAPNGKVFMSGALNLTRYLTTPGNGVWNNVANRLYGTRGYGSSVMYEPGKVLMMGGGDPPTATAETIDLNAASPTWKWTGSMAFTRRQLNATILADGKVLVSGGTSSPGFNNGTNTVLTPEIWDPATGKFTKMANMQRPRLYHSTAVLLPDGRVLSAGSGRPHAEGLTDEKNAEIFWPPYLFKGDRPRISRAPEEIGYGEVFSIRTIDAASIGKVTLVRLSSVTHAFNMNQRFNSLAFTPTRHRIALNVTAPANGSVAPPGHYLLFILTTTGVPSVARIVHLG